MATTLLVILNIIILAIVIYPMILIFTKVKTEFLHKDGLLMRDSNTSLDIQKQIIDDKFKERLLQALTK